MYNYLPPKNRLIFFLCFIIIVLYFLPYLILGENSKLLISDNLDSSVANIKVLIDSGKIFSLPSDNVQQIFTGIPLSSIYSNYDLSLIWFKIFGIFYGYVFNKFLMAIVGFIGMYLLLKRHFFTDEIHIIILFGVALLYSLLPFWSFTMSVAGLPLLLFAFLNLRNSYNYLFNWIIIIIFPFYSSLVYSGIFFIVLISVLLFYDYAKTKNLNFNFLAGLALLSCLYVVSHLNLFYTFFFTSGYVSHRVEFSSLGMSFKDSIKQVFEIFVQGHYHTPSLHKLILVTVFIAFYFLAKLKMKNTRFIILFVFILVTSVFYGMLEWKVIIPFKNLVMSVIPIQLQRFHWIHPMFWYILFGVSLALIYKYFRFGSQFVYIVLCLQFVYVVRSHELIQNRMGPSFSQFYAEQQFQQIKSFIGKPQNSYRVVSLGLYPSIAQFNGFYTLDGYIVDYPIEYKHQFRMVIGKEIEKDSTIKNYFDKWGSRCYAFSSELGMNFLLPVQPEIERLDFDFDTLLSMRGEYIISKTEINTKINNRVLLMRIFENSDSFWKIFLYRVL